MYFPQNLRLSTGSYTIMPYSTSTIITIIQVPWILYACTIITLSITVLPRRTNNNLKFATLIILYVVWTANVHVIYLCFALYHYLCFIRARRLLSFWNSTSYLDFFLSYFFLSFLDKPSISESEYSRPNARSCAVFRSSIALKKNIKVEMGY